MKRVLMIIHGSFGDLLPFVWLGKLLRNRGHVVTLLSTPNFSDHVKQAGLEFWPQEDSLKKELDAHQGMSSGVQAFFVTSSRAGRTAEECLRSVDGWVEKNGLPDLLVSQKFCFSAWMLREKWRRPLLTVHLFPFMIRSLAEPPVVLPALRHLRRMPAGVRRLVLSALDVFDRLSLSSLRPVCEARGIKMPRKVEREWTHSPDGSLAFFPEWFAAPQDDWPRNLLQWDFPLEDGANHGVLQPELENFLASGEKPVVFSAGSGNNRAQRFFHTAVQLVRALRCRAVFISTTTDQLPADLPAEIFTTSYVPFGAFLPRCRAYVHHGGIGTTSQCFAAGIPQMIVPITFDQPDNADRMERLGVGAFLNTPRFNFKRALPLLRRCLEDPEIRAEAQKLALRLKQKKDTGDLLTWIEARSYCGGEGKAS